MKKILTLLKQVALFLTGILSIAFYIFSLVQESYLISFGCIILGIWFAVICLSLSDRSKTKQEKKLAFRILSLLMSANIILLPTMILNWTSKLSVLGEEKLDYLEMFTGSVCLVLMISIGVMIGLEVKEKAADYASLSKRKERFFDRRKNLRIEKFIKK